MKLHEEQTSALVEGFTTLVWPEAMSQTEEDANGPLGKCRGPGWGLTQQPRRTSQFHSLS